MLCRRFTGSNSSIFDSKSMTVVDSCMSIPHDRSTPQQPMALTVLKSELAGDANSSSGAPVSSMKSIMPNDQTSATTGS